MVNMTGPLDYRMHKCLTQKLILLTPCTRGFRGAYVMFLGDNIYTVTKETDDLMQEFNYYNLGIKQIGRVWRDENYSKHNNEK